MSLEIKDGFIIDTVTKESQTGRVPRTTRAEIVRMNDRELVAKSGTQGITYKRQD